MDSVHGTRTIRLQRKKSGLGFSVKGGKEHGVPIVVSWIKPNGAAAKQQLRLGDVILAVNGRSLQGASHGEAVQRLKQAGTTVLLRVKPDHILADVFSTNESSQRDEDEEEDDDITTAVTQSSGRDSNETPLPSGWGRKVDARTGRPYYENHYTETSSWGDPRSLTQVSLRQFDWSALPPSWEQQMTDAGDVYYVCHDTQTTHWESPRGLRQLKQLKELVGFLQQHKLLLKERETELAKRRERLLDMNTTLTSQPPPLPTLQLEPNTSTSTTTEAGEDNEEAEELNEKSSDDVINDMMSLNEEVEVMNQDICLVRNQLKKLGEIISHAQYEDIGEEDEYEAAANLSAELVSDYNHFKTIETKLQEIVGLLEELRKERGFSDTPLSYMMQLPPRRETEEEAWLHTLPDRLTGKTNCEMRVERQLLKEMIAYGEDLTKRLSAMHRHVVKSHDSGWSQVMEELAGMDLSPLQDEWLLNGSSLQEKLDKLVPQTEQWSMYTKMADDKTD